MHTMWFVPPPGFRGRNPRVSSAFRRFRGFFGLGSPLSSPSSRVSALLLPALAACLPLLLAGCGSISGNTAGVLLASSSSVSFGNVPVGQSASATVSLSNSSSQPVQISQLSVSGQYFSILNQNSIPMTVPGGGTISINLQFNPGSAGQASGSLVLNSNASSGSTAAVSLAGTGTAATTTDSPAVLISPSPGSVLPGSSATFTWTPGSGVAEYQLWLGSTGAGSSNLGVYTATPTSSGNISQNVTGLPTSGATVYARLLSQIQGSWQANDYTFTEAGATTSAPTSDATVSNLACSDTSITGADADSCTVTLSSAASSNLSVSLTSDNSAVTVPASVTVPAGAASAPFTATVVAVTSAQNATLTASTADSAQSFALQLNAESSGTGGAAALTVSANRLAFGNVTVNTAATQSVTLISTGTAPLIVSAATLSGAGFSVSGASFPATLMPGQTATLQVQFDPASAGSVNGSLTINSNSSTGGSTVVSLSGTGDATAGTLRSLMCTSPTLSGAATDNCTVTLTSAAPTGGVLVSLTSSSSAVIVPAAISVPVGATTASFTATAVSVTSTQTVDLIATTPDGQSKFFALQLEGQAATMTVSASSLSFGNVNLNTSSTQALTLISTGASAVTITSATMTGAGFTVSGSGFPVTLNPGQTLTLQVRFDPTTAGAVTGSLAIASNSTGGGTTVVSLSGTGESAATGLSGLSCAQSSLTAAGTDTCTVSLTAAAPAGGQVVTIVSNNSAVIVPASVTVPAGATTAGFSATISAVTSSQTAILTANAGGVARSFALQLSGGTATLSLSAASLSFGSVALNTPTTQSVTLSSTGTAALVISGVTVTGADFTVTGASFPVTLNPGQSVTLQVKFDTATTGSVTGSLAIASNSSTGATTVISLSGTGQSAAGALSAIACATGSFTAAGTDACTVTLTAAAPSGGLAVTLASSSTAVVVPGSITVPAGATTAGFTAAVSAVTSSQTATLTATAGGVAKTFALQIGPGSPGLTINATTISFGNVTLNSPATQSVTLTSSGTAAVTINAAAVAGTGFTLSAGTVPVTLNPGQTATLSVQFDPTTAGAATGTLTITSNAASGGTILVALTGTGQSSTSYEVALTWSAPASSSDPVAGYNVYRQTGTGSYQLLNASVNAPTTYTDTTVQSGVTYNYEVKSVDAQGNESTASNVYTAAIP
ncbi:MAG: choice-of-anchor D domain-containing protein [Acidobacteriaceae bacterium]